MRLKRESVRSTFAHALDEYAAGRVSSSHADLLRVLATTDVDESDIGAFRRVLVDRVLRASRQLAPPIRHNGLGDLVAFSPDGTRVLTGSKTAQLWAASAPTLDLSSRWSSSRAWNYGPACDRNAEGNVKQLTREELDQLRENLGDNDVLTKFQTERFARNRNGRHRAMAAEAEEAQFAAAFHLRHLVQLEPGDTDLPKRLDHAKAMLETKPQADPPAQSP